MTEFIKGERVMVDFGKDEDHKHYDKYQGKLGFINEIACKWNPIPIIKFDDKKTMPIEGKYLKHLKQQNLFSYG